MAKKAAARQSLPKLTKDGVKALIKRLSDDIQRAQASTIIAPADKQIIQSSGTVLIDKLNEGLSDPTVPVSDWVSGLAGSFKTLASKLAPLDNQTVGACHYEGSTGQDLCIVCRKIDCDTLGGVFTAGVDCSGQPLP
jgi:hypothetical protein